MSPWEVIGWLLVVPMALMTLVLVYAVSVAAVRAIVSRGKRRQSETVTKGRHLKAVD